MKNRVKWRRFKVYVKVEYSNTVYSNVNSRRNEYYVSITVFNHSATRWRHVARKAQRCG
jgi:hypothetical protein